MVVPAGSVGPTFRLVQRQAPGNHRCRRGESTPVPRVIRRCARGDRRFTCRRAQCGFRHRRDPRRLRGCGTCSVDKRPLVAYPARRPGSGPSAATEWPCHVGGRHGENGGFGIIDALETASVLAPAIYRGQALAHSTSYNKGRETRPSYRGIELRDLHRRWLATRCRCPHFPVPMRLLVVCPSDPRNNRSWRAEPWRRIPAPSPRSRSLTCWP